MNDIKIINKTIPSKPRSNNYPIGSVIIGGGGGVNIITNEESQHAASLSEYFAYDTTLDAIKCLKSFYSVAGVAAMGAGPAAAGGGGGIGAIADAVDVAFKDCKAGDILQYNGTHWVNKTNTNGLTNVDGIIIESPEAWLRRIPLSLRRVGMEVVLRTSLHDDTYTRYAFRTGIQDTDFTPVDYFVGIAEYIIDNLDSDAADKALSARQGKILKELINNKKLNCGTYG